MSIKLLDEDVIEQIAAGEVVENPASVVKELVENSLDAGATVIEVKLKRSGLDEIVVIDNGSGICKEDVDLSFKRHATSKISLADDLFNIRSLGFRGEALASIAAVSKLSLTTRFTDDLVATSVTVEKGVVISSEEVGAPIGTEVVVKDLFYNTPARRAFLKSPAWELKKVSSLIIGLAFSAPQTAFYLWHENKLLFKTKGDGNIPDIIGEAYGNDVVKSLLKLPQKRTDSLNISGYISNPLLTRANRKYQTLLINNRLVINNSLSYALKAGYRGLISGNRFPVSVVRVNVAPEKVDVNIHPAKTEVRFHNEKEVSSLLHRAVTEALGRSEAAVFDGVINRVQTLETDRKELTSAGWESGAKSFQGKWRRPELDESAVKYYDAGEEGKGKREVEDEDEFDSKGAGIGAGQGIDKREGEGADKDKAEGEVKGEVKGEYADEAGDNTSWHNGPDSMEKSDIFPNINERESGDSSGNNKMMQAGSKADIFKAEQLFPDDRYRVIGQFKSSYLLAQRGDSLVIIDQHAAHERILYEKFKKAYEKNKDKNAFVMTSPLTVEIPFNWRQNIDEAVEYLQKAGFEIEFFGEDTLLVRAVPVYLKKIFSRDYFMEILEKILDSRDTPEAKDDMIIKTASCKEAIKIRKQLAKEEMERLIEDLYKTETPHYCPHGRPIVVSMELFELEKSFKRR